MKVMSCLLVIAVAVINAASGSPHLGVERLEEKSNQHMIGVTNVTISCVSTGEVLKRGRNIVDCSAEGNVIEVRVVEVGDARFLDAIQVVGTVVSLLGIVYAAFYQRRAQKISLFEKRNLYLRFWNEVGKCLKSAQDDAVKGSADATFNAISFVMRFVEELKRSKVICTRIGKDDGAVSPHGQGGSRTLLEKVIEELLMSDSVFSSRKIPSVRPVLEGLARQIEGNEPKDGVVIKHEWMENEAQFYGRISETLNDMKTVSEEMQKEMSLTKKWFEFG